MAHGVITWLSMQWLTALKRTLMWSAVSLITVTLLSGLIVMWIAPTHLCWGIFMRYTTSVSDPNKVRLGATCCAIGKYVISLYHFFFKWRHCHNWVMNCAITTSRSFAAHLRQSLYKSLRTLFQDILSLDFTKKSVVDNQLRHSTLRAKEVCNRSVFWNIYFPAKLAR